MIPALIALGTPSTFTDARERVLIDTGWRFHPEDVAAAAAAEYDDSSWRTLDLPHDWSIEALPNIDEPSSGGGGFFPTGIGWYRRTWEIPREWEGRRIVVEFEFEGVYRNATVWFNGSEMGWHPYGYTPFAFDRAEYRKVELLKQAGFNAIRTSHNPPSTAFFDACDQLGLLVMDESFDGWTKLKHDYSLHFADWALRDVESMVRRDRNHPSVVMWSIGNEVFERGNAEGRRIARELSARIRELDRTRPVTAGINGMGKSGQWTDLDPLFAILDIAGYNYEMNRHAEDHARLPGRIVVGTESYLTDVFAYWKATAQNSYVLGEFVWTAMDFLGEAGIGRFTPPDVPATPHWEGVLFPWHGAYCGDIDLTGWRKPVSHYRNIVWNREEDLYAAVHVPTPDGRPWNVDAWGTPPAVPSWTWPGHEGKPLTVEVYSRFESVQVFLNDKLAGEKPTTVAEQFRATFQVSFRPGALRVVGLRTDGTKATRTIATAGLPARIALAPDRRELRADGQDLLFVEVEIQDSGGRRLFGATPAIAYSVEGPAAIAGIGSADLAARETYRANPRRAFQGRALVVLRTTGVPGLITLAATAEDMETARAAVVAR